MFESKGKLVIQCDEMWSFVMNKNNKVWIWLAIDEGTGEIVGVYQNGSRDITGTQELWDSLPHEDKFSWEHVFGKHINLFFLSKDIKHLVKTVYVERLNNTLR